jgi:hypothetical protein
MICSVLAEFGGYTYQSLMAEDAEFLKIVAIRNRGRREEMEGGEDG